MDVYDNETWLTGYKVVKLSGKKGVFKPATPMGLNYFSYQIGKSTVQDPNKSGPMAIFNDKCQAMIFLSEFYHQDVSNYCILKVKYIKSEEIYLWRRAKPTYWKFVLAYTVTVDGKSRYITERQYCPKGTIFAKTVIPEEIVNWSLNQK